MALKIVPELHSLFFNLAFQVTGGIDTGGVAREFLEMDFSSFKIGF